MRPSLHPGTFAFLSAIAMVLTGCGDSSSHTVVPPLPTVTVVKPIEQVVTDTQEFTGTIQAKESVQIRARVSGYLDKVGYKEGQEVKTGDVLFVIDQRPFQADLDKAKALLQASEAKYKLAEVDFGRAQELIKQSVISAQEFDTRTANFNAATADRDSNKASVATAQLNLDYTTVTAPVGGITSKANITVGNLISSTDILTTIVSVNPIYVYFNVDERTLQKYRNARRASGDESRANGSPVRVALAGQKDFPYEGTIDYVSNQLDAATGNFVVRAVLDNKDRVFIPGFFARVSVPMSKATKALLIPERAIGSNQGRPMIYILGPGNKVVYRDTIELGQLTPQGLRVISTGLAADETVIVDGILSVRPGIEVKPESIATEVKKEEAAVTPSPAAAPAAGKPAEPKK
ncbi:MAG: efflux RND transporter periplasmic adaptor subunit [Candidatus Methylacidiphilales bacterium]|nr:efflux RND transporter periplasmic adaptor subunit [Candidatus Methylacidiphilales bacterium]